MRQAGQVHVGDVADAYGSWPSPHLIVSDGAYGVGGFHGDPRSPDDLADWYEPHIVAWSKAAEPRATLWFWNTEVGWATVHPVLVAHGWEYQQVVVWDKGLGHIAGNVNGKTLRRFPVVTEVCAIYSRALTFPTESGPRSAQAWLRHEWRRAGLALRLANDACEVKNAATRKYLTTDWRWYFPPPQMMTRLVAYANRHGEPTGRPYYSLDGERPVTESQWADLRYRWHHHHGVTNVWSHPPLAGHERLRGGGRRSAPRVHRPGERATVHLNQKPLAFMERIVQASTDVGDVVWEPFGGLCTAAVAATGLGRLAYAAEVDPHFAGLASSRLLAAATGPRRI